MINTWPDKDRQGQLRTDRDRQGQKRTEKDGKRNIRKR